MVDLFEILCCILILVCFIVAVGGFILYIIVDMIQCRKENEELKKAYGVFSSVKEGKEQGK